MTSKILRGDGVTELANIKSVTYTETVNAGDGLRPGCVASSSINVECYGAQTDAPSQDEALTYYQVVNGVETLVGIFYAEPSIPSKGTYKFVAYDSVAKLDVDFSARLNAIQEDFPMSIYDLVSEACSVAGVTLGSSSWPLSTQTVQAFYSDNLTCRNILQYAAEIACRFVRCNTSGEVIFDWYTTNSTGIYPGGNDNTKVAYKQNGLTYDNSNVYVVDSVAIKPSGVEGAAYIYPTSYSSVTASDPNGDGNINLTNLIVSDLGNGELFLSVEAEDDNTDGNVEVGTQTVTVNPMIFSNNLLLTNASDVTYLAVAQNIYDTMSALPAYRHATLQLFVDENPFRAGEFVSVTDAQGVTFNTPVFTMTVAASGATLQSSGKAKYQNETTTSLAKSVANLASNIVQIDKLKVGWAEIEEAIIQYLKLYGYMAVYEDNTLTSVGGRIGYMAGSHEFPDGSSEATAGIAMVNEASTKTHYIIVTDSGVRLQEHNNGVDSSVYLADGNFFVLPDGGMVLPKGKFLTNINVGGSRLPRIAHDLWVNSDPTTSFSATTLTDNRFLYYDILIFEIAWSTSYPGVVNSAVVYNGINAPPQGNIIAHPSVTWYDGSYVSAVYRQFTIDGSSIQIGSGCHATGTSVSTSANGYAIPIRIMGIMI